MAPRTILYTGKGGVGKTSVAAATGRECARAGLRTLVFSTDPAHSLADVLQAELTNRPTAVSERLFGQQVEAQREMEANWAAMQEWLGEMLMKQGVDRISAEELTVPPGADELFSLLQLKRHNDSGEFDAIVVDCAPTGETLRLLSFPDVARWWLERVFPWEKQILAAAAPIARGLLDVPLPGPGVVRDVRRLIENLIAMHEILRDREHVSVRLVMTPDRMVIAEAMRTFTYLNLYGFLTDAVIVNRIFPPELDGTYFDSWRAHQHEQLALVESGFAPVPVLRAPFFEQEVVGEQMLDRLAGSLFADCDPASVLYSSLSQELRVERDSAHLRIELPFAQRGDISLKQLGLELIVGVDGQKRTIMLPPALAALRATQARLADGALEVTFENGSVAQRAGGNGAA
ncbi:MAG TPA: ArsA family ATPase [Solirubrobacteraceae bacterium]|nr:ArsA family ATPase [Solirubrobacteraceae bacterium]